MGEKILDSLMVADCLNVLILNNNQLESKSAIKLAE